MLKKLTATGIVAGAATGVMLFSGPAGAARLAAGRTTVPAAYTVGACDLAVLGLYQPAWCNTYAPTPYYPPPAYYPPTTYYPGYHYGWDRWHRNPYHVHY
jgi:hypothetical protein